MKTITNKIKKFDMSKYIDIVIISPVVVAMIPKVIRLLVGL